MQIFKCMMDFFIRLFLSYFMFLGNYYIKVYINKFILFSQGYGKNKKSEDYSYVLVQVINGDYMGYLR